eukprot:1369853-Pyramimonas_sp.AAC.1
MGWLRPAAKYCTHRLTDRCYCTASRLRKVHGGVPHLAADGRHVRGARRGGGPREGVCAPPLAARPQAGDDGPA